MPDKEEARLRELARKADEAADSPPRDAPSRLSILTKGKRTPPKGPLGKAGDAQRQSDMSSLVTENPFADASDKVGTQLYLDRGKKGRVAVETSDYLKLGVPIWEQLPNIKILAGRLPFVTRFNTGRMTAREYMTEFGGVLNEYTKAVGPLDAAGGGVGLARKNKPENFKKLTANYWDSMHGHGLGEMPDRIRNRLANIPRADNLRRQEKLVRMALSTSSKFHPYQTFRPPETKENWMKKNPLGTEADWELGAPNTEADAAAAKKSIKENFLEWNERISPKTKRIMSGY
jgi:hypothetical protein